MGFFKIKLWCVVLILTIVGESLTTDVDTEKIENESSATNGESSVKTKRGVHVHFGGTHPVLVHHPSPIVVHHGSAALIHHAPILHQAPIVHSAAIVHHTPYVHSAPIIHHAPIVHHASILHSAPLIHHAPLLVHHYRKR